MPNEPEPYIPTSGDELSMLLGLLASYWRPEVRQQLAPIRVEEDKNRLLIDLKNEAALGLPDVYIPITKGKGTKAKAEKVAGLLWRIVDKGKVPDALVEELMGCVDVSALGDPAIQRRVMELKIALRTWISAHPPPQRR